MDMSFEGDKPSVGAWDPDWGYAIAEADLWPAIGRYVTHIETGETKDTCKCEWLEDHTTGLKMQRVEENLECPVHTKEGFLLGFFRWMFPDGSEQPVMPAKPSVGATMMIHPLPELEDIPPVPDLPATLKARIAESGFRARD